MPRSFEMRVSTKRAASPNWWWIVLSGILLGILLSMVGFRLEGGALAVLAFAPLYLSFDRKLKPDLFFGPGLMVYLYHVLGYALGPLAQRYIIGSEKFIEEGFVPAQWGAVIGLCTFALIFPKVFQSGSHRRGNKNYGNFQKNSAGPFCFTDIDWKRFTLVLLGWTVFIVVVGFVTGAYRRLGNPVQASIGLQSLVAMFIQSRVVVWFFLGYAAIRFGRKWARLWFVFFLTYSAYSFLDGSRGWVAYAMLYSTGGAAVAGYSRKKLLYIVIAFVVIFAPFASIVSNYRIFYREDIYSFSDRIHYFGIAINYFSGNNLRSIDWLDTILDQSTAHTVDLIFLFTPSVIPYSGFDKLERIPYIFVPRILLPNQPKLETGGEIAFFYQVVNNPAMANDPRQGAGNYTPTVGDGYRRFGWIGIPVLYALQAVIFGFLLRWTWEKKERIDRLAMALWLLWTMTGVWSMPLLDLFYTVGWTIPKYFFFFWFLNWISNRFARKRRVRFFKEAPGIS